MSEQQQAAKASILLAATLAGNRFVVDAMDGVMDAGILRPEHLPELMEFLRAGPFDMRCPCMDECCSDCRAQILLAKLEGKTDA